MFEGKNMNDTTTTTYATLEDGRILVELNPSVRRPVQYYLLSLTKLLNLVKKRWRNPLLNQIKNYKQIF